MCLWDNDEGAPITDSMKYMESQKAHGIRRYKIHPNHFSLQFWLVQIKTSGIWLCVPHLPYLVHSSEIHPDLYTSLQLA